MLLARENLRCSKSVPAQLPIERVVLLAVEVRGFRFTGFTSKFCDICVCCESGGVNLNFIGEMMFSICESCERLEGARG